MIDKDIKPIDSTQSIDINSDLITDKGIIRLKDLFPSHSETIVDGELYHPAMRFYILDSTGEKYPVHRVQRNGSSNGYKITFVNGLTIICSKKQRFQLEDESYIYAEDITAGDYLRYNPTSEKIGETYPLKREYVPLLTLANDEVVKVTEKVAYAIGWQLSSTYDNTYVEQQYPIDIKDTEEVIRILEILKLSIFETRVAFCKSLMNHNQNFSETDGVLYSGRDAEEIAKRIFIIGESVGISCLTFKASASSNGRVGESFAVDVVNYSEPVVYSNKTKDKDPVTILPVTHVEEVDNIEMANLYIDGSDTFNIAGVICHDIKK